MNVALDRFMRALGSVGVEIAGLQQVDPSNNGIERVAQFVRHGGQKFILDAVCRFGLNQCLILDLDIGSRENPTRHPFGIVILRDDASEMPSVEAVVSANSKFKFELAMTGERLVPLQRQLLAICRMYGVKERVAGGGIFRGQTRIAE